MTQNAPFVWNPETVFIHVLAMIDAIKKKKVSTF